MIKDIIKVGLLPLVRCLFFSPFTFFLFCFSVFSPFHALAQIGEHRSDFAIGVTGGYIFSNVNFSPTVAQGYHGGMTGGIAMRYTCEKYFKTICSLVAEVNYSALGWKEEIKTRQDKAVIGDRGVAEKYERTINYIQIPAFAHLAWGRETQGFSYFLNLGPQFGIYLSDKISKTYDEANVSEEDGRSNTVIYQETTPIDKKFDYGITVGAGIEYSHHSMGHFLVEARYYYGLGNIFNDSKRDYFGNSNFRNIVVKATYFFDVVKSHK